MARPRRIDRDDVLRAALDLADAEGIDAVTMAAVARRLGVTPMALYRHVADKADLLDGLVELLLEEAPALPDEVAPQERLALLGRAARATAQRHPAVYPLLLQRPAATPAARRTRDRVVAALRELGVADEDAARAERLISTMVLGFAASEASGRFRNHSRATIDADYAALEESVRELIDRYRA